MLSQLLTDVYATLVARASLLSVEEPERVFTPHLYQYRNYDWARAAGETNGLHVFIYPATARDTHKGGRRMYQISGQLFVDCVSVQQARKIPAGHVSADEMAGTTLDFLVSDTVEAFFGAPGIDLQQPAGTYRTGDFPAIEWFDTGDLNPGPERSIMGARLTIDFGFEYRPGGVNGTPIDLISVRMTGAQGAGADVEPPPPEYY